MATIVNIDGDDYDGDARADGRVLSASLLLTFDGYDSYNWVEQGCGPSPTFLEWMPVTVTVDGELAFSGRIKKVQRTQSPEGWQFAYRVAPLKELADTIPVRARDGSAEACFNMPPSLDDPSYIPSLIGQTVGEIVEKVLTVPATAQLLDALGVGNFTGLPSAPVLPADTLADLATLDLVPRQGVVLSGLGVLNQIEDFVGHWHRKIMMRVQPDGVIRFYNILAMPTTHAVAVPGDDGGGDPIDWPSYDRDIEGCFTQVQLVGRDISSVTLSTKDGTLTSVGGTDSSLSPSNPTAWGLTNEGNWRLSDFTQPRDASDRGTASSVTLSGCTVASADASVFWSANFWNGRQGRIYLYNDAISGGGFSESRAITTCSALTAGGTATIGWDSSIPLSSTSYNRYRIESLTGDMALVGRRFLVRDKTTGDTGLDTFVGAHLVTAFPEPVSWGTSTMRTRTSTPVGAVFWSIDGTANGFNSITIPIEVDPEIGGFTAGYPVVRPTATQAQLERGYPTTFAAGKPTEFRAIVAFERGSLVAQWPASGYSGGAYTQLGMERALFVPVPRWTWAGDAPEMLKYATELHASLSDPVDSGSVQWHGMPAFGFLDLGYAITMGLSDASPSPWDGLTLPVRSVTLNWMGGNSPVEHTTTLQFSNKCRPFEGDSLNLHPAYGGDDFGDGDYMAIGAGFQESANPFALPQFGQPGSDLAGSGVFGDRAGAGTGVFGKDAGKPGDGIFGLGAGMQGSGVFGNATADTGMFGAGDQGTPGESAKRWSESTRQGVAATNNRPGPIQQQQAALDPAAGKPIMVDDPAPAPTTLSERRKANRNRDELGGG